MPKVMWPIVFFLLLGISNIMYMIICLNSNVSYSMHLKED